MEGHRKDFSVFQLIDRKTFDALVKKYEMDKWVRNFSTWEFTCALITSFSLGLGSYREIELALGIPRSTFCDAMNARFHGFFQELYERLLHGVRGETRDRKTRRAIREVLAIDSTECGVHASLFRRPGWNRKGCTNILAAAKAHIVYDVDGNWIDDFRLTGGLKHDSPISFELKLRANKTYVFDRAYSDLSFWFKIVDAGSQFVTRLKNCESRKKLESGILCKAPDQTGVLWDGFYLPSVPVVRQHKQKLSCIRLRHIVYRDPLTKKIFHFLTSDLFAEAQVIADIYKRRWAIELLFRWLKGHLGIRYLPVKSINAVKIQLSVAILTHILLQLKKVKLDFKGTLWTLLRTIRTSAISETHIYAAPPTSCRWNMTPRRIQQGFCL